MSPVPGLIHNSLAPVSYNQEEGYRYARCLLVACIDTVNRVIQQVLISRSKNGSAITEFGPALFFLLMVALFPLIDISVIGLTYCSCTTLNDLQADKAKLLPKSMADDEAGPVKAAVPSVWQKSGFGAFAKLTQPPVTQVAYITKNDQVYVEVTTTCSARPLIPIPFIPGVPGISAPLAYTIKAQRLMEDPSNIDR